MYKAFDEYITDDKAIKGISEQRSIGFDVLEKSFDIVKKFILAKKRIIYGGMSIDMALKAAKLAGIYAADAIPDYDFMSPDLYNDSIELADMLFKEFGDVGIDAINALHPTTRRVRINYVPVADITYVPPSTYDRLPTIDYKGFRVIHPTFQRLDMHRAFCNPLEHVPREVVFFRTSKDIKRFELLDSAYPLLGSKLDVAKTVNIDIPTKYVEAGLVGGLFGHALLTGDFVVAGDSITVPAKLEKIARKVVIMCDDPMKLAEQIQADYNKSTVQYYSKFQDDVRPPSIIVETPEYSFDIQDAKGRMVPYVMVGDKKVVSHHGILMNYLERHFNTDQGDNFMWLYCKLMETMKRSKPAMAAAVYGFYNWSSPYIVNAQRQYAQIESYELASVRPPSRYNPADDKKPGDFDPKKSWVFAMDGSELSSFTELTLRFEKR